MNNTWGARFVDKQVGRAWLDLRLHLADRLAEGLASGEMDSIDISTARGETLTVDLDDERVVIIAGDHIHSTANVDEAAYTVFQVLHEDWQVIHPVFLDSALLDVPAISDNPVTAAAPVLGRASSKEELQRWVVATFSEGRSEPLKVDRNGDVSWRTRGENRVLVKVHNAGRVELLTVLGRNVGLKKAHKVIDKLSRSYFGLKFFLVQDTLVMSQIVIAHPFSGEQLDAALRTFVSNTDALGWVAEKVLRNRVRTERELVAKAQDATAAARAALVEAEAKLSVAEMQARQAAGSADRRAARLRLAEGRALSASRERDAAKAELARLKHILEKALDHQTFFARPERGEAA